MKTKICPGRLVARFMRFFFRLLYHQFAWSYDFVAAIVSIGRWNDWVRSVLPYAAGSRILEIGHGPGHLQKALLEQGLKSYGLDESKQMSALAFRRLRKCFLNPMLSIGYAQFMPFKDCSFDSILVTFPSEYIADPQTLREIERVLAPGGHLTALLGAWITGRSFLDRAAALLFRLTGQAPAGLIDQVQQTLQERNPTSGLVFSSQVIHLPTSSLFLVHARKPAPGKTPGT